MATMKSPFPDVDVPEIPFGKYVYDMLCKVGDETVLIEDETVDGVEDTLTAMELQSNACRVVNSLVAHGVTQQDVYLFISTNSINYAIAEVCCYFLGVTFTVANSTSSAADIAKQALHCGVTRIGTEMKLYSTVKDAVAIFNKTAKKPLKEVMILDQDYDPEAGGYDNAVSFNLMFDGNPSMSKVPYFEVDLNTDMVFYAYTAGTTGPPKAVIYTHYMMVALMEIGQGCNPIDLAPGDRMLVSSQIGHATGTLLIPFCIRQAVLAVIIPETATPRQIFRAVDRHSINYLTVTPELAKTILETPMMASVNKMFTGGKSKFSVETATKLDEKYRLDTWTEGFLMTEFMFPFAQHPTKKAQAGSGNLGVLTANVEAKIVDPKTGAVLPVGQDGELCLKGPMRMSGYLYNNELTKATIKDHWLHTGDIGHFDADGCFFMLERKAL